MRGLYFASYAIMATVSLLIVALAQYNRKKNEGTPYNITVLKALGAIAIAMWLGSGIGVLAYKFHGEDPAWGSSHFVSNNTILFAGVVGTLFVAFFLWQMIKLSREFDQHKKTLSNLEGRQSLTDSWNLRILRENLKLEIMRAQQTGTELFLLIFQIDDLHKVNKTYGDQISHEVSRTLISRIFTSELPSIGIYRFEGERFALILPGSDMDFAEQNAINFTKVLTEEPYYVEGQEPITLSVKYGIASYSDTVNLASLMIDDAVADLESSKTKKVEITPP